MSSLSFFLSSTDMATQTDLQSFGPVMNSEATEYRVTSKLSVENKNIYAVSDGEIIVTNSINPDLVNIFLKPEINYATFQGIPKVKYFVYRGIKKSSFFNGNDVKETEDNGILEALNKGASTSGGLSPVARRQNFKDSYLAITNLNETYIDPVDGVTVLPNLIDTLFLKEDYNQIYIKLGQNLGICSADFGFEIMLEENGFNPSIAQARLLENIIDTTIETTEIKKEIKRLEILNYIDPAAFFGLFTAKGVFGVNDPNDKKNSTESVIYTKFVSKFFTKNNIYIDIRNKFSLPVTIGASGQSFTDIKISTDGTNATQQKKYKYYNNGSSEFNIWPIFIVNSGFLNKISPPSTHQYYRIKISLPKIYSNNQIVHNLSNHLEVSWPIKKNDKFNLEQRYVKLIFPSGLNWSENFTLAAFVKFDTSEIVSTYIKVEYTEYTEEGKITAQVINYKLNQLSSEIISNQLSPTLINLGHTDELTREKDGAIENKYKTYISGLGNTLFSDTKGIACELTQGKAIDTVGEICFAYRTANNIQVSGITLNNDRLADKGESANQINKDVFEQSFTYNKIQNHFTEKLKTDKNVFRSYEELVEVHNDHKKNKSILSVHKVKFTDGGDKKGVELRVNDPIILRGLIGNSPAECFLSIAYTYSQRQTIYSSIKNNFETEKFVSFISHTVTEITTSGRKVFKQSFKLLGIKANGNSLELQEEPISIIFYSIDGSNFVTPEYAELFKNELGKDNVQIDRIITNDIIPQFESGNPFNNPDFETNTLNSINALLNTISNNGQRDKILYNEIRDYIYDGDLDNLTFEIAFRLPFYIEVPRELPYTQVSIGGVNYDNNPFITYFEQDNSEEWFTQANLLRTKQINPILESLDRSGLTTSTSNKKSYFNEFYDAAKTTKEAYFNTVNLPINAATTFNWENPKSYFEKHGKHPHLPVGSNDASATFNTYSLEHLESAGVITLTQKNNLNSIPITDFGYEEISDGTYTINGVSKSINGKYVFKEENESTFKIYDFSWTSNRNASGITFGFGYDIGSRSSYTKLLDYLNLSSSSVTGIKQTVLNKGLGKKKMAAQKEFWPFKKVVWDTISLDYNITIDKTKPILQDEYLNKIISYIVAGRVFMKIYINSEPLFYKNDELKILNFVELCVYSTFVWNRGSGRASLNSKYADNIGHAKRLIHALNTHDIRWMRYFVEKSGIFHSNKVNEFLSLEGVIKHYKK